jgi:hypothetical protein
MNSSRNDTEAKYLFPPPPINGSERLVPITSWAEMFRETQLTRVEFDAFWYERVEDGIAYFFKWLNVPRATVLVVWDDIKPTHIECRSAGDMIISEVDAAPILAEVVDLFRGAGFWEGEAHH